MVKKPLAVMVAATPADGDALPQPVGQGEHLLLAEVGKTVGLLEMEELGVVTVEQEEEAVIMVEAEKLVITVEEEDLAIAYHALVQISLRHHLVRMVMQ